MDDGLDLFEDFLDKNDDDEDISPIEENESTEEVGLSEEEIAEDIADITKIRYWLRRGDMTWFPNVNRPPFSGWYLAYLVNQEGEKFQWVAQFDTEKMGWTCPLPFLVQVSMWTYFPPMPSGHHHMVIKENW